MTNSVKDIYKVSKIVIIMFKKMILPKGKYRLGRNVESESLFDRIDFFNKVQVFHVFFLLTYFSQVLKVETL